MARPRQPLDPEREDALVRSAARAFASDGYAETSLNSVLAEAGWGKSSFYHYFSGKTALHDHVVARLRSRLTEDLVVPDPATLAGASSWERIAALLEALVRNAARAPETRHLGRMFHDPAAACGPRCGITALREEVHAWVSRAIARGRETGALGTDLDDVLQRELAVAVLSRLDRWNLEHPGRALGPESVVDVVRRLLG